MRPRLMFAMAVVFMGGSIVLAHAQVLGVNPAGRTLRHWSSVRAEGSRAPGSASERER